MTSLIGRLLASFPGAEWDLVGDTYDGLTWYGPGGKPAEAEIPADIPKPVPLSVHAYQFAGQAAYEGIISEAEGKAWAGAGTVPGSLQAAVDKLVTDVEAHDRVTFFLVGATEFPRYHPNTVALGATFGKDTPEKLDAFFVAAGER